ncbi:acyltransferase family protein [Immundisolibacter sp.]
MRALAVMPVLFFHAGLGFPGGFVGVDVFFVISGYLITRLLTVEMTERRFSLFRFYERRIRRIFPALFTVLMASTVVTWFIFMPPEFELFGQSMALAAIFASNIGFWQEAGYFDTVAQFKPLLHTWSLGIEEQFYVLFPLLLAGLYRGMPTRRRLVIGCMTVASFLFSVVWVHVAPNGAFFLLPARFWELGVGCLLALAPASFELRTSHAVAICAAGLLLIGMAVFGLSEHTPFPGMAALLPCIGTVLVIMAGRTRNAVSCALGSRPLVLVGLVSYSLYLWHWPIIVFAQYRLGHLLSAFEAILAIVASFALAALSWRFIEQPARQRHFLAERRALFGAAAVMMVAVVSAGLAIQAQEGLPGRLPAAIQKIYAQKQDRSPFLRANCFADSSDKGVDSESVRPGVNCPMGAPGPDHTTFLVWGDSHAAAMAPAIDLAAKRFNQRGLFVGRAGCPPLLHYDTTSSHGQKREACRDQNDATMQLIKDQNIRLVFLLARWPREVLGAQNGAEGPFYDPAVPYATVDRSGQVAAALDSTVGALTALGIRVVLVMDVPEPGYDVPLSLARAALRGRAPQVNPTRASVDARQELARQILQQVAIKWGAHLVDPTPAFCDRDFCHVEGGGVSRYTDADHLTRSAALDLTHLFDDSFAPEISGDWDSMDNAARHVVAVVTGRRDLSCKQVRA